MERSVPGEMSELTLNHNWSATPVGDRSDWPISLTTLVNMLLASSSPMLLFGEMT